MKIWNAFGSEHSMNLVMIGKFKEVRNAQEAKRSIDRLTEFISTEESTSTYGTDDTRRGFSPALRELLRDESLYHIAPTELDQFRYDVSVKQTDTEVSVRTDEADISVFLKVMIEKGARVEIYSAHDYPDDRG